MGKVLTLLALLLLPISATAETFDLVCTWSVGNPFPLQDVTFRVDTDRNIVNGMPATISDVEIRMVSGKTPNGRSYVTVINRYTGNMDVSLDGPPQLYDAHGRGTCVKPTQRQF